MTHFFTRMNVMLANVDKKICARISRHSLNLNCGQADFPRKVADLFKDADFAAVRDVIGFKAEDFTDDEFLAEYLTNYFRFARKIAAESKGGVDRE